MRLTACHECDLLLHEAEREPDTGTILCPRCGAELYRTSRQCLDRTLALTTAALILLLTANCFPIVGLQLHGQRVDATIFSACRQLLADEMPFPAALLLLTTVLVPLAELGILAWLLLPLRRGQRPRGFVPLFKLLQLTHPWAMVEVFILGIVVSLIKLSHLADIIPGAGILCFTALSIVLVALGAMLDQRQLWDAWEKAR